MLNYSVAELRFKFVSDNVRALSKNKQHPVMWGHFSDDMPVIVW